MPLRGHVLIAWVRFISYTALFFILLTSLYTKPSIKEANLPIQSVFNLPSALPTWPTGEGFGNGFIDLGGLQVYEIKSFNKIWAVYEGGPDDKGATIFEPSEIPDGFFMLGCYSQANNKPLFGSVLVGRDVTNATREQEILKKPMDYALLWSSEDSRTNQTGPCYIWYPMPPDGYEALGYVVTNSSEKPSLDKIRCVRSDFTVDCEVQDCIWSTESSSGFGGDEFSVYSLTPSGRSTQDQGVPVGTFIFMKKLDKDALVSLSCLKSQKSNMFNSMGYMPNLRQIHALFQTYSPIIYFHPKESYFPSSVDWFFSNGALLYTKGQESSPVSIKSSGENLPQGGTDDEKYWLDLPVDKSLQKKLKKGNFDSTEAYLHVKSMFGGTATDIVIWIFCPFNGPGIAQVGPTDVPLGKIGQHVGDWEHITIRISNFDGMLQKVYFSAHNSGSWVDASLLEYQNGSNKFVVYASLHGHAFYPKPGLVLQGVPGFGMRNDMAKSTLVLDTGHRYVIISADCVIHSEILKPPWLFFARKWGPETTYNLGILVKYLDKVLDGIVRSAFLDLVDLFPNEIYGESGPIGPKMKRNWRKDEYW